jgi:tripartite-type tricarboxylate transporter receptor subunit TctC
MKAIEYSLFCLFLGLALVAPSETGLCAGSSKYPDRPITLVVPFAPGGTTDVCARALAEQMEKYLKQPVVVVSKPGGGTTIAGSFVANAKPDGYTIGFLTPSTFVPEIYSFNFEVPYSSKDLKPISGIVEIPTAFLAKGDSPWNSLKDLLEYAKKNPGMKIATLGKTHVSYYLAVLVTKEEKINFASVPFDGGSKMVPPLLGGHVPVGITGLDPTIKSLLDAKRLKGLAVCIKRRIEILPEMPSLEEFGYKIPFVSITGLFGPKRTPEEAVKKINEVIRQIIKEQEFKTKIYSSTAQLSYLDAIPYEESLTRFKETLQAFFKEEGLIK